MGRRAVHLLGALVLAAGCTSVPEPDRDRALLRSNIAQAPGEDGLATLLEAPVTPDAAARIALIVSPRVRAALAQAGIDAAMARRAILPAGIGLSGARLARSGEPAAIHAALGLDLTSLLFLSQRVQMSQAAQLAAQANLAAQVLAVTHAARSVMVVHTATLQRQNLLRQHDEAASALLALAEARFAAGNIARIDLDRARLERAEAALLLSAASTEVAVTRASANRAMGLSGADMARWQPESRLPPVPEAPPDVAGLTTNVTSASLDLPVASGTLEASRALARARWPLSLLPSASISLEQEREDGHWKSGPGLSLLAPLFDFGASQREALVETALRDAAVRDAIDAELQADAAGLAATLTSAHAVALTRRDTILPLADAVMDGALLDYNAMEIDLAGLIRARQQRLAAGLMAIDAARDYWLAAIRLDLLQAGGRAGNLEARTSPVALPGAASDPHPGH